MNLVDAKKEFAKLVSKVNSDVVCDFLSWIQTSEEVKIKQNSEIILESIADDIRKLVPFDAVLNCENVFLPPVGKNSDCSEDVLVHVDSFLFSDEYIDDLVDEEKFSRNYCKSCGSKDTKPLTFISHSASIESINFLFKHVLPDLTGKILVDIGSRLGPILYGAYLFTSCQRAIGIEKTEGLCSIQRKIIEKYKMKDRIQVVNSDVLDCAEILLAGDVIVMNNVFEFFNDFSKLSILWQFIIETLRNTNKLLISIPSLEESLEPLQLTSLLENFADEIPLNSDQYNDDDIEDIHLYQISESST